MSDQTLAIVLAALPLAGALLNAFNPAIARAAPRLAAFLIAVFPVVQDAVLALRKRKALPPTEPTTPTEPPI